MSHATFVCYWEIKPSLYKSSGTIYPITGDIYVNISISKFIYFFFFIISQLFSYLNEYFLRTILVNFPPSIIFQEVSCVRN